MSNCNNYINNSSTPPENIFSKALGTSLPFGQVALKTAEWIMQHGVDHCQKLVVSNNNNNSCSYSSENDGKSKDLINKSQQEQVQHQDIGKEKEMEEGEYEEEEGDIVVVEINSSSSTMTTTQSNLNINNNNNHNNNNNSCTRIANSSSSSIVTDVLNAGLPVSLIPIQLYHKLLAQHGQTKQFVDGVVGWGSLKREKAMGLTSGGGDKSSSSTSSLGDESATVVWPVLPIRL